MKGHNTSSYFFPNSPHLMKNVVMDSSILSAHKKEIRSYLARQMAQQYHQERKHGTRLKKYRALTQSSRGSKACVGSQVVERRSNKQQLPNKMVGVFNLIQRAKHLQAEGQTMAHNPFYRIQRKRQMKADTRHTVPHLHLEDINSNQNMQGSKDQVNSRIFHNMNVFRAIEQEQNLKTRAKSQTFTYYQIKKYFEQKYGPKNKWIQLIFVFKALFLVIYLIYKRYMVNDRTCSQRSLGLPQFERRILFEAVDGSKDSIYSASLAWRVSFNRYICVQQYNALLVHSQINSNLN